MKSLLMNANCLEAMQNIPTGSVDMVLCDPPYGTTACKWDSIIPLDQMWLHLKRVTKANAAIVITACQPFTSNIISSNYAMFRYCLVWDKIKGTGFLNARRMPMRNHEDIVIFYKKLPTYTPQMTSGHKRRVSFRGKHLQTEVYGEMKNDYKYDSTDRYPRSICVVGTDTQNSSLHPTQKPVALMEYLINTYSKEGATVLDFAMGSGTTGVACVRTKRRFIGIEIDTHYYEIASTRIHSVEDIFT